MATSRRLRALITNDDGIESPGLWALATVARQVGFDVTIAAPHVDTSGAGASVQAVRDDQYQVAVHRRELAAVPGVPAYAVEAHPAFIVHAVGRGWLEAPDVVLSGINLGANTGRAIIHSATVGAALTAGLYGWRALAVSLDTPWNPPEHPHWDTAVELLPTAIDLLLSAPDATILSLNVPDLPSSEIGPLREATLADFGRVQITVTQRSGADGDRLGASVSELAEPPEPGTDTALLNAGHPTITELRTVSGVEGLLASSAGVEQESAR